MEKEIEELARELGLDKNDKNFRKALSADKILAWVGDAVIKLHLSEEISKLNITRKDMNNKREEIEKNDNLKKICPDNWKGLISDGKKQNHATLFEAIIGAVFLAKGYNKTKQMLMDYLPIT